MVSSCYYSGNVRDCDRLESILRSPRAEHPGAEYMRVECQHLYRGERSPDLQSFAPSADKASIGMGVYLAQEPIAAKEYADMYCDMGHRHGTVYEAEIRNMAMLDVRVFGRSAACFIAYLSGLGFIQELEKYVSELESSAMVLVSLIKNYRFDYDGIPISALLPEFFTSFLYTRGYDGLINNRPRNADPGVPAFTEWLVYDPSKIKILRGISPTEIT